MLLKNSCRDLQWEDERVHHKLLALQNFVTKHFPNPIVTHVTWFGVVPAHRTPHHASVHGSADTLPALIQPVLQFQLWPFVAA